jgi:hypothetical protein
MTTTTITQLKIAAAIMVSCDQAVPTDLWAGLEANGVTQADVFELATEFARQNAQEERDVAAQYQDAAIDWEMKANDLETTSGFLDGVEQEPDYLRPDFTEEAFVHAMEQKPESAFVVPDFDEANTDGIMGYGVPTGVVQHRVF